MLNNKELMQEVYRNSNLKLITKEEEDKLKKTLLSCYIDLYAVCKKYNLSLMLGGGSCLGAVRHGGFIPWDDDMDLLLPRYDFEKLKEIFEKELGDKYILSSPNYGNAINRFPIVMVKGTEKVGVETDINKIHCIGVDIFVIDYVPDNKFYRTIRGFRCMTLMTIAGLVNYHENINIKSAAMKGNVKSKCLSIIKDTIGKIFSFKRSSYWYDKLDNDFNYKKETNTVGILSGRKRYFGEIFNKNILLYTIPSIFENTEALIPAGYDEYMVNLYGDYHKIPPEEKREKHYCISIKFN